LVFVLAANCRFNQKFAAMVFTLNIYHSTFNQIDK
jgi:hypothetical protein